jgi:4-diphosphocytidyl-2-C-methyl-D-erythritol kinase
LEIIERAHAKINLYLAVLDRRADGYHELLTVFQSLKLHDTLRFNARADGRLMLSSNNPALPTGPDNLVWRAAELLRRHYQVNSGAEVLLEKTIPVAAGLGGGSSDAAAALRGLSRLWQLPVEQEVLYALAAGLGADVPFFLQGGTALGSGRGDVLTALPACPHYHVLLVNPGFAVSTAKIYRELELEQVRRYPDPALLCRALESGDREQIRRSLYNALETVTFRLFPEVAELKKELTAGGPALMSGSGPTVFLLLDEHQPALELARAVREEGMCAWLTETQERGGIHV